MVTCHSYVQFQHQVHVHCSHAAPLAVKEILVVPTDPAAAVTKDDAPPRQKADPIGLVVINSIYNIWYIYRVHSPKTMSSFFCSNIPKKQSFIIYNFISYKGYWQGDFQLTNGVRFVFEKTVGQEMNIDLLTSLHQVISSIWSRASVVARSCTFGSWI